MNFSFTDLTFLLSNPGGYRRAGDLASIGNLQEQRFFDCRLKLFVVHSLELEKRQFALIHFYDKNFVKVTFFLKKVVKTNELISRILTISRFSAHFDLTKS